MALRLGSSTPPKLYRGATQVTRAYLGDVEVDSATWTPASITTALWLDAADSSTITLSGSNVSQWNDKSGNARHATQATSSLQPTLQSSAYNGHAAVRSDGVDDFLAITPFTVTAGIRAYGVINPLSPDSFTRNGDWLYMTDFEEYSAVFSAAADLPNMSVGKDWYSHFFSTSRPQVSATGIPPNTLYLAFIEQTGTQLKGRVFGTADESVVDATFNGSPTARFQVFATGTFTGRYDIGELIFVQSPSTVQQQKVEGYLAHKWGLAADLPSDHPYKAVAP
jgi:hypothetical protein